MIRHITCIRIIKQFVKKMNLIDISMQVEQVGKLGKEKHKKRERNDAFKVDKKQQWVIGQESACSSFVVPQIESF